MVVEPKPEWNDYFHYEFRRSETADTGEILVTVVFDTKPVMRSKPQILIASPDVYAFTPHRSRKPRRVPSAEWAAAGPVLQFVSRDWRDGRYFAGLEHRGEIAAYDHKLSLSREAAVVFGLTGTLDPGWFEIFALGGRGVWFGDVYHVPRKKTRIAV
jgi:hypothetical protein